MVMTFWNTSVNNDENNAALTMDRFLVHIGHVRRRCVSVVYAWRSQGGKQVEAKPRRGRDVRNALLRDLEGDGRLEQRSRGSSDGATGRSRA